MLLSLLLRFSCHASLTVPETWLRKCQLKLHEHDVGQCEPRPLNTVCLHGARARHVPVEMGNRVGEIMLLDIHPWKWCTLKICPLLLVAKAFVDKSLLDRFLT